MLFFVTASLEVNYGSNITESIERNSECLSCAFVVERFTHMCRLLFHVFFTNGDFWATTPCTFVEVYQQESYIHRKKTEALDSSVTLVITCWTAQCRNPHNLNHTYWRKLQTSSNKCSLFFFHTYVLFSITVNKQNGIRILRTILVGNWCSFWRCTTEQALCFLSV